MLRLHHAVSQQFTIEPHSIRVLVIHGAMQQVTTVADAIQHIRSYQGSPDPAIEGYEIEIRYSNGDVVTGNFHDQIGAIEFLERHG